MLLLLSMTACGGLANDAARPRVAISTAAKGAPGGGGGVKIPPPPTTDAAAQFLYDASEPAANGPDIDYGALPNTAPGAISVGTTRSAQELVFNVSSKTALVLSSVTIVGANPGDFAVTPGSLAAAVGVSIPPNKGASVLLNVTFTPTDAGVRTAFLQVVSNAGTAFAKLTGEGLPFAPQIPAFPSLSFLSDSAPDTLNVTNQGGSALILSSIGLAGANPEAFALTVANAGLSNCYAGIQLAPHSTCFIGIGVAAGATGPATGTLVVLSNDPVTPETDVALSLTPAPAPAPDPTPAPAP